MILGDGCGPNAGVEDTVVGLPITVRPNVGVGVVWKRVAAVVEVVLAGGI